MPDISKCEGGACPKKNQCYRFLAIPSEGRQSYLADVPWERWNRCDYFWQVEPGDRIVQSPDVVVVDLRYSAPEPDDNRIAHPPIQEETAAPPDRGNQRKTGSRQGYRPRHRK